ncbi:flagellar basal body rod C-terminal domain-containing protein [Sphingomonas sp.]|uniref:FlgK family flagellar hook-associated protein n=1 Tax=Sphingomonas sp. TaxID=28214 RepID=UPI001B14A078|nr:flagellar basal body rod C-terminal domain-containing protein [Sphingomonas sp.]MBO9713518.1 flagellar biosynthesis protein FlgK [Sphingomonas sp.]
MALNDILSSAVSGLAAAQAGLRSVSNNIANVNTAGYARERVSLSTSVTGGQVNGVVVGEPTRVADRFLEATVYRRAGDSGRADVQSSYLDRLQALLGEPGSKTGLPARLDAITASATAMTGAGGNAQTVAQFTADVQDGINSLQQLKGDVSSLRSDVESEVGFTVDKVNSLLQRINDLNNTIVKSGGGNASANGAIGQRMSAIQELSGLMAVTVRDQSDGRVTIDSANGQVLLDKRLRQLSYTPPGQGVDQATYPDIDIRFANADGSPGAATGDKIDSAAVGGKLGGLLDLRDRALPQFSEQLGVAFTALAESLNAASNANTTAPPPNTLTGRSTGLTGSDRLGFTGKATFAVTQADGTLVAKTSVDFDALGPTATVDDMVNAINAGLGGTATASFTNGTLSISAASSGNGVVVAQDANAPSARAGAGVSQYFGLNDVVRSDTSTLVPSGFNTSDPHGFTTGETTQFVLRDSTGRKLGSYTLQPTTGGTFGDIVNSLNGSPLGSFGSFSLDTSGRMRFTPAASVSGAVLSTPVDSTERSSTGRSLSDLMGLTGASSGLDSAQVRQDINGDSSKLPLAQFQDSAAIGTKAVGANDTRGATGFVDKLAATVDLGKDGVTTVERFTAGLLGKTGLEASQAKDSKSDSSARLDDAVNRRDSFSGVNIDEELAQMVVLQNSYSAAARVISTATQMYDSLLAMVN